MCRQRSNCSHPLPPAEDQIIIMPSASQPWPEDAAILSLSSLYNRWTYSYMNRIFKKGALQRHDKSVEAQLTQQDLYRTPKNDEAALLNAKFWAVYKETNYNFRRTLWLLVKPVFMPAGIWQAVALAAQLSIPMCVMKLLQEIESKTDPSENIIRGTIGYVLAIFFLSITNALCTHRYQFLSYESGIIIRSAVTCAIYERSLDLSPRGRMGLTSGNVTNLVATDTQKLFEVMHDGHQIWSCPLAIVIVIVLLLLIIGPTCLVGAAVLIGLVPLSKRVAQWIIRIRKKRVAVADERIEIVSAMLQDIKITKLMNYEDEFERRVQDARRRELSLVRKEQFVWGLTLIVRVFTPVLASFATFVTYVMVSEDNIMSASIVFTLTMLFNMLKFPINQAGQLLSKAALGVQAIHRISHFMGRETKEHGIVEQHIPAEGDGDEDCVLEVKDGTFHLGGGEESAPPSVERMDNEASNNTAASFTLSGINFRLNKGEVLAVVGPVASGKSTFIQGLLGDVQSSTDTSITMASGSNVSYAAQTPFILSTTVRENITFGSPFDRDRYDRVLDACCLRPDLKQWNAGDLTEIGERGVTMSGGQKQRVSVARAVYADPSVGLFDDILSALDAGTSQKLFDNLFDNVHDAGSLLHNCGVVLVTHSQHILQRVDKIMVLDNGESIFHGSWAELQSFEVDHARHKATLKSMKSSLQLNMLSDDDGAAKIDKDEPQRKTEKQPDLTKDEDARKGEITEAERREHGVSSLAIWLLWFKYAGGILFVTVQVLLMGLDRGSYVAIDFWLATWTSSAGQAISVFGITFPDQYETQLPYVLVYTCLTAFMFCFLVMRSQWMVAGGVRASKRVFSTMTHCVLHAPMSYFDTTPMGRILNRFTYDVEQVDIILAQFISIFVIGKLFLLNSVLSKENNHFVFDPVCSHQTIIPQFPSQHPLGWLPAKL